MDLSFNKPGEIVKLLCERLRKERLSRQMTQADVAARAGIGVNTVSNLEAGRNVGFESVIRVATVLGRLQELQELFKPQLDSLDDMLRYENSAKRQRVRKKSGMRQIDVKTLSTVHGQEAKISRVQSARKPRAEIG